MNNTPLTIFVDSDAFIAFVKQDDSNHEKVKQIFNQLQETPITFLTSNYVFSEVVTVLSQRVSHDAAVAFIVNMTSGESVFQIERIDEKTEALARQIFIEQTSKNISFVDCTNIALIKARGLDGILSFDSDYKQNNIQFIEDLI